jgi:hypothetical protein
MLLHRKPVILLPGFGGSKLVNSNGTCPFPPKRQMTPTPIAKKNGFINLSVFEKDWEAKYRLKFDKQTGLSMDDNIDVHDFGGVEGIRNLCEDCTHIDNVLSYVMKKEVINNAYNYKYFDTLVKCFERTGYVVGNDLFGAPYDFRKIMIPEYLTSYFGKLKALIERSVETTGRKGVIVCHSIGCLIFYMFLVEYCDTDWKHKHIDKFISVAGPYGGSSIALKTLFSGLPRLNFLKDKYFSVIQNSTGMILALPNMLGYAGDQIILHDQSNRRSYRVHDYFEVLPEVAQHVWVNDVQHHLQSLLKNTEVDTIFVTCTSHATDVRYTYSDITKNLCKEPIIIKNCRGDSVIPRKSLLFHNKNRQLYPNYRFIDVPNTEHTKILHTKQLLNIIKDNL